MHPALCADIIDGYVKSVRGSDGSNDNEAKSIAQITSQNLAMQAEHKILYENSLGIHFLEVRVVDGIASLYGVSSSQALIEAALKLAKSVPGIKDAVSEIQVVQEFVMTPQGGVMP
jgi:osmotically-inducible protein OsmY